MSARATKRSAAERRRDKETRIVASLIDPATTATAAAIVEKIGLRPEMLEDEMSRDNYETFKWQGAEAFKSGGAIYLCQMPVAELSTADAATLEADCREIVETWRRAHPEEMTPEEILAQAGMAIEDAADFLKRTIEQPQWIVSDFIAQHMKGDLCGGAKSMKTFAALQLAVCIAAGRDFLNVYHVDRQHTVAYLNLELFDWNAQERLNAQTTAAGLDVDGETIRGRLYLLNMRANPAALRGQCDLGACGRCKNRDACHGKVESICRAQTAERIVNAFSAVLKKHGVELVIIDPRYKLIMPGEDENTGDGLRGVLALRDALARHFAVMIVTHDPKGDTAERKTVDRGAGSYTAGADFDFRFTIDRSKDYNEEKDDLLYVVAAACRARKSPPKVGVRFDPAGQIFKAEDGISTELLTRKAKSGASEAEKTAKEREKQEAYAKAAVAVVESQPPGVLLSCTEFDNAVAIQPGAYLPLNERGKYRKALVDKRVLKTTLERDAAAKPPQYVKKHGKTYISTPDRIDEYLRHSGVDVAVAV